jgi:nucleoporin NUP159
MSGEEQGGLAVFDVAQLMTKKFQPGNQVDTKGTLRAVLPNPTSQLEHIMAVVHDTGKLQMIDIAKGQSHTIRQDGVACAAWSTKGKAIATGLTDGTGVLYLNDGTQKGVIPRPPGVSDGWLSTSSHGSAIPKHS